MIDVTTIRTETDLRFSLAGINILTRKGRGIAANCLILQRADMTGVKSQKMHTCFIII